MNLSMTPSSVAEFLSQNPDFFYTHSELFTRLKVAHPHEGRTVSLADRQNLVLKERLEALEKKNRDMILFARENEAINTMMLEWCRGLLAQRNPQSLPDHLTASLMSIFNVPEVTLRLWGVKADDPSAVWAADVPDEIKASCDQMRLPYCGNSADIQPAQWLSLHAKSVALIPLRVGYAPTSFGLLVLGSADAQRFQAGMGTDFLQRIGEFASASLSRLMTE